MSDPTAQDEQADRPVDPVAAEISSTRESVDKLREQIKDAKRANVAVLAAGDDALKLARLKVEEEALKAELAAVQAGALPEAPPVPTETVSESAVPEGVPTEPVTSAETEPVTVTTTDSVEGEGESEQTVEPSESTDTPPARTGLFGRPGN